MLRPGVRGYREQTTDDGNGGAGFSLTSFGEKWLSEAHSDIFIPTEPERFAEILEPFKERLGLGFFERAQQSLKCYGARAYLASCVMSGAAAESALLAIAIAKTNDEPNVLKKYFATGGRGRVEDLVVGKSPENIRREFHGLAELLKYWRDEAGHGRASGISENEAYTSIVMLVKYALFICSNWDHIIKAS